MSIDGLSYDRLHSSALLLPLRLENYSKYFILSMPFFIKSVRNVAFTHSVFRRSLSPFSASLPLLRSVSSAPALMSRFSSGRSCARSRQSSSPSSGDASLLGGTLKFFAPRRCSQFFCSSYSILCKTTLSHRVPGLMTEDLPVGLLGIHSLGVFSMVPNRVMSEMGLDGGGHLIPAGKGGLHTLYLLLLSQSAHDRAAEVTRTHTI